MRARRTTESGRVADKTAQTIYIDADPSTVMDVIADIGSGTGYFAVRLARAVAEAFAMLPERRSKSIGVDLSKVR